MKTDLTEWNDPVTIRWTGQTDAGNAGEQPARDNRLRATDSRRGDRQKPVIPSFLKNVLFRALKCLKKLPAEGRFYRLCVKKVCPFSAEPIQKADRENKLFSNTSCSKLDAIQHYAFIWDNEKDFNTREEELKSQIKEGDITFQEYKKEMGLKSCLIFYAKKAFMRRP